MCYKCIYEYQALFLTISYDICFFSTVGNGFSFVHISALVKSAASVSSG